MMMSWPFRALLFAGLFWTVSAGTPAAAKEFRYAGLINLPTLEPYWNQPIYYGFLANVYEALTAVDSAGNLVPKLAERWETIGPDRWRFYLRRNVKFHHGSNFTADDVLYSFKRAKHPNANVANTTLRTVKSIDKVDSHTIEIVTHDPDPVLPFTLNAFYIMSQDWIEKNAAQDVAPQGGNQESFTTRHASGTGQFKLKSLDIGVSLELDLNTEWWGPKRSDNMTSAKYFVISNASTQLAAIMSNGVDLIMDVPPSVVDRLKAGGINIHTAQANMTQNIGMDVHRDELLVSSAKGKNPFKDQRVRDAIFYAVDVHALVDKIMRGYAFPAGILVSPVVNGFDPKQNDRAKADVEKAKALMAEAGYADGFSVRFDCVRDYWTNGEETCEAITAMLARIGIRAQVDMQMPSVHWGKLLGPRFEGTLFMASYAISSFDAGTLASNYLHSRTGSRLGLGNIAGGSDAGIDRLVKLINSEMNEAKRREYFSEMWTIVREKRFNIPLFQPAVIWGVRSYVGAKVDPLNRVDLSSIVLN